MSTPATPYERSRGRGTNNLVFKCGALFISSKGLGWKSWKRRWFILTRTSLVFYKSDPNAPSQKGSEPNLALGGIDLNSSGSVLVRADKKLLTVLFPDGRAFTLKAETSEDLDEWKIALERAICAAPSAALVMGQSGIFKNDSIDAVDGPSELGRGRKPMKSMVVGRPILLALEDIDGSPSFLEKALCYIEQYGVSVEGILRQSADVDEVDQRVREYEHGKCQFGPDEDAHVIGDCIKHVLRELPSLPVPTPCCTALLEAQRMEVKEAQIKAMHIAVAETFPEPNRRLLQRVLKMMRTVAAHASENRMTTPAVAACMAPLLLRPLLTGECGLEDDSDISGDSSAQLLAAAAAANCAQAVITTLMEEYDAVFRDDEAQNGPPSPDMYARAHESASEASSDGEVLQVEEDYHDVQNGDDAELDEDPDRLLSGSLSESSGNDGSDVYDYKAFEDGDSDGDSPKASKTVRTKHGQSAKVLSQSVNLGMSRGSHGGHVDNENLNATSIGIGHSTWGETRFSPLATPRTGVTSSVSGSTLSRGMPKTPSTASSKRSSIWGLSATKRNLNPEAMNSSEEEELAIQRLEATRNDLRTKIAKEAKGNAALQQSLERRKQALHGRRLVLEQDVTRLQEQLQAERDLRAALEIGLTMSASQLSMTNNLDSKTRAEFEEIAVAEADVNRLKQRISELHAQLNHQRQQHGGSLPEINARYQRVKDLHTQQIALQQELDVTLALCQHENQKNNELQGQNRHEHTSALEEVVIQQRNALAEAKEVLKAERMRGVNLRRHAIQQDMTTATSWRGLRPPAGPAAGGKQFAWRGRSDSSSNNDSVPSHSIDGTTTSDMGSHSNGKRVFMDVEMSNPGGVYQRQAVASSALVELTTRLDFFKERRSQLMEQLHNLDSSFTPIPVNTHDLMYSSSPPWARPG